MTKYKLFKLHEMVADILERYPATRDNDRELALRLHFEYYGVSPRTDYADVMRNELLPTQESISRCRRKVQEKNPSLRGTEQQEQIRMDEQAAYIAYAAE